MKTQDSFSKNYYKFQEVSTDHLVKCGATLSAGISLNAEISAYEVDPIRSLPLYPSSVSSGVCSETQI